jgi:hypothetical protein
MRHVVGDRLKFLLLALLLLHIYRCLLACTSLAPELARSRSGSIFQRFPQSIGVTFVFRPGMCLRQYKNGFV